MAGEESSAASSSKPNLSSKCSKCLKKVVKGVKCLICGQLSHQKCVQVASGEDSGNIEDFVCGECTTRKDAMFDLHTTNVELLHKRIADLVYIVQLQKERISELENRSEQTSASLSPSHTKTSYSKILKGKPELIQITPIAIQDKTITRNDVKSQINPAKLPIGISNMRQNKQGDIIINCPNNKSAEVLLKEAKQVLGDKYTATIKAKFNPRLKIMRVEPGDIDMVSFRDAIITQNQLVPSDPHFSLKVITTIKQKSGSTFTVIEVDARTRSKLMREGRINYEWKRYHLFDHIHITQCFKCAGFNHIARDCTADQICLKCSGTHLETECKAEQPKCANCLKSQANANNNTLHDARYHDCPTKLHLRNMMEQRIAYDTPED
jgi:hypothetical protein